VAQRRWSSRPLVGGTAEAYLERRRGPETARLVRDEAVRWVQRLGKVQGLTSAELPRAIKVARQLRAYLERDSRGLGVMFLDQLIQRWHWLMGVGGNGRPPTEAALFVEQMLHFGAAALVPSGQRQLTPTELIAAAASAGLRGATWSRREDLIQRWVDLRRRYLRSPRNLALQEAMALALKEPRTFSGGLLGGGFIKGAKPP
jgi:hypothetical protein